jgi:hypothetical protein
MDKIYYTGIGSRETPQVILDQMVQLARHYAKKGYILRSGGADGSDFAFAQGCDLEGGQKEIYLPWRGFNKNDSPLHNVTQEMLDLAESIHPAWTACSQGAKKLHARNTCQVLGEDLKTPSKFLVCWTPDGKERGGTRTAIVLAKQNNIPVYNIFEKIDEETLLNL